jgi:uncharacterized protein YcfL
MRNLSLIVIAAVALLLAGCASTGTPPVAKSDHLLRHDSVYIAKVEQIARSRGVEVHWVNPPRERERRRD